MTNQVNTQTAAEAKAIDESALPDEEQVVEYLINNPDFFLRHAALLNELEIQHESGKAVSLIERQVSVLREKNAYFEDKLKEMVDAVHDNQRLHMSLQRLAINLFAADGKDDVLGIIDDELRHKLATDYVAFKVSDDIETLSNELPEDLFSVVEKGKIHCGQLSAEQLDYLFPEDKSEAKSAAIIPVSGSDVHGIIALASKDEQRYHPAMGTDFLASLAELISAALAAQWN